MTKADYLPGQGVLVGLVSLDISTGWRPELHIIIVYLDGFWVLIAWHLGWPCSSLHEFLFFCRLRWCSSSSCRIGGRACRCSRSSQLLAAWPSKSSRQLSKLAASH